jgi:hypothetical protein
MCSDKRASSMAESAIRPIANEGGSTMSASKRFAVLGACVFGLAAATGAAQAGSGAAGSPQTIALTGKNVLLTWILPGGEKTSPNAAAEIGSTAALSARLYNRTSQFGKGTGMAVGRILLSCTVLRNPPDGNCTGIVHLPNGYFLIGGNGPFVPSPREYAITGGVGPYATARGEVTITTAANRTSVVDVKLAS